MTCKGAHICGKRGSWTVSDGPIFRDGFATQKEAKAFVNSGFDPKFPYHNA